MSGYTTITVLPAPPVTIEVTPSSNIFVKDAKTTILVRLLDAFGNYANGNIYKLSASASGGGVFLDEDGKELGGSTTKSIVEGYTSFDLTSHSVSDSINLKFSIDEPKLESSIVSLRSIDFAKISTQIEGKDSIVVGKEAHRIKLSVLDRNNQVLRGFNGIASIDFPKLSGVVNPGFVKIVDGVSQDDISLTPKYVA